MVAGYPCRSSNTRTWHICQQGAPFGQNVRYHCHINIGWMRFWEGIVISRGMTDLNSHEIHQSSCFRYSVINYLISSFSLADHTSLRFGSSIRLTHRGVTDILLMSDPFWAKNWILHQWMTPSALWHPRAPCRATCHLSGTQSNLLSHPLDMRPHAASHLFHDTCWDLCFVSKACCLY